MGTSLSNSYFIIILYLTVPNRIERLCCFATADALVSQGAKTLALAIKI